MPMVLSPCERANLEENPIEDAMPFILPWDFTTDFSKRYPVPITDRQKVRFAVIRVIHVTPCVMHVEGAASNYAENGVDAKSPTDAKPLT
jgi:hypothetical protein